MPELYIIPFTGFELRDSGGALTNQETNAGGDLIGWNTDSPGGAPQDGGAAADQWVANNYTLTLTSLGDFYDITDPGDLEFEDDDGDQVITNDITFGPSTYPAGSQVEAEFHIEVQNPATGEIWVIAAVSIGGSDGDGFQTVEGLAIVDNGDDDFPPLNVPLNIISSTDLEPTVGGDPVDYTEYAPCFVAGAMVETPNGPVAVEDLCVGDLVHTIDNGPQPVRWVGSRILRPSKSLMPIRIPKGELGASADLLVSPQHRIRLEAREADLMFGSREILVKAKDLARHDGVGPVEMAEVEYFHILFDRHELVTANGVVSESFQPSMRNVSGFDRSVREEIFTLFPELKTNHSSQFATIRYPLKRHEALALASAV